MVPVFTKQMPMVARYVSPIDCCDQAPIDRLADDEDNQVHICEMCIESWADDHLISTIFTIADD
jgi:hypothetical protein